MRPVARAASSTTARVAGSAIRSSRSAGEGDALDARELDPLETRGAQFPAKLVRSVAVAEERTGEERHEDAVALHLDELLGHDREPFAQPQGDIAVQPRRPARDRRCEHRPAQPNDPARLRQRRDPVAPERQVVKRAEQQHCIDGAARQVDRARVAEGALDGDAFPRRVLEHLLDVERHRVAMNHVIAEVGEPDCIAAGAATDVGDPRRSGRQRRQDQLRRPRELDLSERGREPVSLLAAGVMLEHGCEVVHGLSIAG